MGDECQPKSVTTKALKDILTALEGNNKPVVLAAYYSKILSAAISETINCIIV
ncbi:MAG TPA: hypothetical protein VFF14_02620 [Candidatus Deferrimicrobium sp.]|nr:hypothetical protein [Candidatus Deferrimicrobium sp.]